MRRFALWAAILLLPVVYLGSVGWAAWDLRVALKTADRDRLAPRVAWPELRQSLKARIVERTKTEGGQGGWVRQQAGRILAPTVADRAVDLVVTPERLAWLLKRRLDWRQFRGLENAPPRQVPLDDDDDDPLALEPSRLKWAFFESPATFRIEVRDKRDPRRTLVARLGLRGLGWQLVDIDRLETQ
ncbi:MAG: hypothetical protein RL291_581 [Pseudomonadota bacterium]